MRTATLASCSAATAAPSRRSRSCRFLDMSLCCTITHWVEVYIGHLYLWMIVHVVIKLSARVGRSPVVYTKRPSHFGDTGVCPPFLVRLRLRRLHVLLVSSACA